MTEETHDPLRWVSDKEIAEKNPQGMSYTHTDETGTWEIMSHFHFGGRVFTYGDRIPLPYRKMSGRSKKNAHICDLIRHTSPDGKRQTFYVGLGREGRSSFYAPYNIHLIHPRFENLFMLGMVEKGETQ